jgi:plastocyanin
MHFRTAIIGSLVLASAVACNSYTSSGPYGSGDQGGDTSQGGGPVGSVTLGPDIRFVSSHNGSRNPAVDTIPVGGSVTWTWTGSLPHGVQSLGSTSFPGSTIKMGGGTYAVAFTTPGTYQYDCAVHGTAMRGTVVVQ